MSQPPDHGIDRAGLDAEFDTTEARKSNLLIEGQMLSERNEPDAAADRFARAAEIEEQLADRSAETGLQEKSWIHRFSAASCWARAGDFHTAIVLGEQLLAQPDLPARLRQRVQDFTQTLRRRRIQWAAGLALTSAAGNGD